jgi:hypothetical protein
MNGQQWLSLALFLSSLAMTSVAFIMALLSKNGDGHILILALLGTVLTITAAALVLVGTIRLGRSSPWKSRVRVRSARPH